MSYDVRLVDPATREPVAVGLHEEGGTYCVGGRDEACLNITYNYSPHYYKAFGEGGIRSLYGKRAGDCIPDLERAVAMLGTVRASNYWESSAGNAGYALSILLGWARLHPDAVFDGD